MNTKELCLLLLKADTEQDVVALLEEAGYWENPILWRPVGDTENNKSVIMNQQEDPVSALAEKLTNCVDAVLLNECLKAGINPRSPEAPQSLRQAVRKFFGGAHIDDDAWDYERLSKDERRALAQKITLSVTGSTKQPSISIADEGEGQTPDDFPKTFMSLIGFKTSDGRTSSQKRDIPFVQGQYNMGGSGAYSYCSPQHNFQLVISRRNPQLLGLQAEARDSEWGFTIVRRREERRGSVYEYLAPVGASEGHHGGVLSFSSSTLAIFPEMPPQSKPNKAYARDVQHGTLVKLYEYQYKTRGTAYSHIFRSSGLKNQLELVMPECGLPVRMVEARDWQGKSKPGSFQTNLVGVVPRLESKAQGLSWADVDEDDQAVDLDEDATDDEAATKQPSDSFEGPPVYGEVDLQGVKIPWNAYIFKDNAGDFTDSGRMSLIFSVNGQKHAHKESTWFKTKNVNLKVLAANNTILVVVDCTSLGYLQMEKIFKASRDRLNNTALTNEFLDLLADSLHSNERLRLLQNEQYKRKQQELLNDKGNVRNVLEKLLKASPMLARFFKLGPDLKVSKPFPDSSSGTGSGNQSFKGKPHPTFLHLANGQTHKTQTAHEGSRVRIQFVTDAVDEYFTRRRSKGQLTVQYLNKTEQVSGSRGELANGVFSYTLTMPEGTKQGDKLQLTFSVTDRVMPDALTCTVDVVVEAPVKSSSGTTGRRRSSDESKKGSAGGQSNLSDLDVVKCAKEERTGCVPWPHDFDDYTAVKLQEGPEGNLRYLVNADNIYLKDFQKQTGVRDAALLEEKFVWGLVLLSLPIVEDFAERIDSASGEAQAESSEEESELLDQRDTTVATVTAAQAKVILPTLDAIGSMPEDIFEDD